MPQNIGWCQKHIQGYLLYLVALNTRTSQTTKKTPFEIVFGQLANSLDRFEIGSGSDTIDEEELGNLFSDTPASNGEVGMLSSSRQYQLQLYNHHHHLKPSHK